MKSFSYTTSGYLRYMLQIYLKLLPYVTNTPTVCLFKV